MSTFQPQQGFPQFQQQPQQGQMMTNITVQPVGPTQRTRQLSYDAIKRRVESAVAKGPAEYWQATEPSRVLKLTGATRYVDRKYAGNQGSSRFVYWPDYRVAGTIDDIVNVLRQAGVTQVSVGELNRITGGQAGSQAGTVALSEQIVANNSFDPLIPAHRQVLEQLSDQLPGPTKTTPKYSLETYIMIGKSIKANAGGKVSSTSGTTTSTGRTGTRSPDANRQRLVNDFSQMMQAAAQLPPGQDLDRVYNVTNFDSNKFTGARRAAPPKGGRAQAVRPYINYQGRQVLVPIIAQPTGVSNFQSFVRNVVAQSPFAQYADEILSNFQQQLQQRQGPSTMGQFGGFQAQPQMGGFQAQPQMGGFQAQPQMSSPVGATSVGGVQLPRAGGMTPGSMQLPRAGGMTPGQGGVQLPRAGGTSPRQGGFQLPTIGGGGSGSPGSGAGSPSGSPSGTPRAGNQLPTMGGGIQLPGTGGSMQFPTVSLPGLGQ